MKASLGLSAGYRDTNKAKVHNAARNAIHNQILAFRRQSLHPSPCTDVDHTGQDFKLLEKWMTLNNFTYDSIAMSWPKGKPVAFLDPDITVSWQDYHRQHAKLQLLDKKAHKQLTASRKRLRRCVTKDCSSALRTCRPEAVHFIQNV